MFSCVGLGSSVSGCRNTSLPLSLPEVGDVVLMIVTSVSKPQRFFAQLPFGASALALETGKLFY